MKKITLYCLCSLIGCMTEQEKARLYKEEEAKVTRIALEFSKKNKFLINEAEKYDLFTKEYDTEWIVIFARKDRDKTGLYFSGNADGAVYIDKKTLKVLRIENKK